MAVRFDYNRRGGLTLNRDSLHESDGYKRQVEALKQLSDGEAVMGEKMTNAQAAEILRQYNAWRRGNDDEMPDAPVNPTRLGKAIDHAVAHLTQPAQAVDVEHEMALAFRAGAKWADEHAAPDGRMIGKLPEPRVMTVARASNEYAGERLTAAISNANGKEDTPDAAR